MKQAASIEKTIVGTLESGPMGKADLIREIGHKTGATAQGVYKALRRLKREETITVYGKTIGLSLVWINNQTLKYSKIAEAYQTAKRENYFLQLKPGEHIMFKFHTLRELDLFWTHAFVLLGEQIRRELPVYAVVPHDWFFYARPDSDKVWTKKLEESSRPQRVIITHPYNLDKDVVLERKSKSKSLEFLFGENPLKQDEKTYINIIGKWIFEVRLDKAASQKLTEWISGYSKEDKYATGELNKILNMSGTNKLKIIHSPRRVETLVKKLKKFF